MKQKILKLAKRLNKFNVDDIAILAEIESNEIEYILQDMVLENNLKADNNGNYLYLEKVISKVPFVKKESRQINEPDVLYKGIQDYLNASYTTRKRVDRGLKIMEMTNGLAGQALKDFLNSWNKDNPDESFSLKNVQTLRRNFNKEGIKGLIPKNASRLDILEYPEEIFLFFKDFYMSHKKYSVQKAYELAIENYKQTHPDFDELVLPKSNGLYKRLRRFYTKEEINYQRNNFLQMDKMRQAKYFTLAFSQAADEYVKISGANCRTSTLKYYKAYLSKHINPHFGKMILSEITEQKVDKYKNSKLKEGMAIKTINNHVSLIVKIISQYNNLFKAKKIENYRDNNCLNILTDAEIKKLLSTAKLFFPDFYPLVLTALNTGITRSEIFALSWDDINWKNKTISVNKSIFEAKIVNHKTNQTRRTVNVSPELLKELEKWFVMCPKGRENLVFPNSQSNINDPDNMMKRRFLPLVKKAGIEKLKFVDLRDNYAALLIRQNLPLIYIQEQLGHSSVQVTAERYKKLIPDVKINTLEIL
ncbi:MAG: tyrosine-type recombinase/integrase [Candidatus Gastranaerophilales bacterium]|nr:tyrosine-type recombinase/integrase [Candidatus Gastranaerophilales bacterium]